MRQCRPLLLSISPSSSSEDCDLPMGDRTTTAPLAKARMELEDLYLGVPDESVDLSFKDLTGVQQNSNDSAAVRGMASIEEEPPRAAVNKSPSLDFAKGLRGTAYTTTGGGGNKDQYELELYREHLARNNFHRSTNYRTTPAPAVVSSAAAGRSAYEDDLSAMCMGGASGLGEPGRRKRTGIPHSNICALCSSYVYFFRHRCLVCGRVYCRSCVGMGMGEMSEGRKCVECLGKRYSQRYIKRAGQACFWRYPNRVKLQELTWAEKGPRRSSERRRYRSGASSAAMLSPAVSAPGSPRALRPASRFGSPVPGSPVASHFSASHDNSFVLSSAQFSPNPHGFHFPL